MKRLVLGLAFALIANLAYATEYYIGPNGVGTSPCTANTPPYCSVDFVKGSGGSHPGDTVWVHGGTYNLVLDAFGGNNFRIHGTAGNPVIVRAYPGERAIFTTVHVGESSPPTMTLAGVYAWWWDLEITQTETANRVCTVPGSQCLPSQGILYGEGINVRQGADSSVWSTGSKIINCIIHDTKQGISSWEEMENGELYGNVLYYNGWSASDRGHGHAMYIQGRQSGDSKVIKNNISFRNASHGHHSFGSSSVYANNLVEDRNIAFGNSDIPEVGGGGREFLIGGTSVANNDSITNNFFYGSSWQFGWSNWPANSQTNSTFSGNYNYISTMALVQLLIPGGVTWTGDTVIYDGLQGFTEANFPGNTYSHPKSAYAGADKIQINPNTYDANRCHIAIHNPDLSSTVAVNLATCGWSVNDNFQVKYVGDYFGPSVLTGQYAGGTVNFPMTGLIESDPAGNWSAPVTYAPRMAAFVAIRTSVGTTPTPTNTNTFTNTPTFTPSLTPTPTQTPTGPPTSTPTPTHTPIPGGCTYIEAEASAVVAPMVIETDPDASGGQYVSSPVDGRDDPNSGTATFTFSLPNGTWYFNHRVIGALDTTDSFFTSRDGEADTTHIDDATEQTNGPAWQITRVTDRAIGGPAAGNPAQYQTTLVIADSPASHTFKIRQREPSTKLDWVAICPSSAVPGDPPLEPTPTPTSTPTATQTPGGPTPTATGTPNPNFGPLHWHRPVNPCRPQPFRHNHPPSTLVPHKHRCPVGP